MDKKILLPLMALLAITMTAAFFPTALAETEDLVFEENLAANHATDSDVIEREGEAMSHDGYSTAERHLLESGEKHNFEAEVSRLMNLIIHSLYSNRDIFLRELVSNASDALDKIRFIALTDKHALDSEPALEIRIKPDPENNTLTFSDTGVGMTRADLIKNLGTIAKSGTQEFVKAAESSDNLGSDLIGQFGVGFYSAFLVANRVTVTSKHNDDDQHIWSSDAHGGFQVIADPEGNTIGRGTHITLHLNQDSLHYLQPATLRSLVKTYSEFINFPIYLWESHIEEREVPIEDEEEEEEDELTVSDVEEDDWQDYDIIEETVWEWVLLNDVKPLWTRDPSEITDEEYIAFYHAMTKDTEDPYTWTHFKAEGELEFKAVLYLPQEVPDNMFDTKRDHDLRGLKLYVRRVFISDNFDTIIPKYLSFVRGVVDSDSLALNVSREILQQDKSLKMMERKLVRKAIAMIQQLSQDDPDEYLNFYSDFKINLKLGIIEDRTNQARLGKLLRFYSSKSGADQVSLDDYIENMKEGQESIYYIAGETRASLMQSPLLESLVSRGYEVLFFTDSIDEYWSQNYPAHDGHRLINIAKDVDLDLPDDEDKDEQEQEELKEEFQDLVEFLKDNLKGKVVKVEVSSRLTKTPSALISTAYSYSANMERIIRAQALSQGVDPFMMSKKILEVNPKHPLIQELNRRVQIDAEDSMCKDIAEIMYETAALHSGYQLDDPSGFAGRIHRMMAIGLDITWGDNDTDAQEDDHLDDIVADDHQHDEL